MSTRHRFPPRRRQRWPVEPGADEVILYTRQEFAAEVKRLTNGKGVNVVYDSVGKTTFEQSLNSLAPLGYMVLYGQASGPVPPFDAAILNTKGSLFLVRGQASSTTPPTVPAWKNARRCAGLYYLGQAEDAYKMDLSA